MPADLLPLLSNDIDGAPIFALLSFTNFGKARSDGVEVSGRYFLDDHWQLDVAANFFSFGIDEEAPENVLSANAIHF